MDLEQKRILITGGYGFLGDHICQNLLSLGIKEKSKLNNKNYGFYRFRSSDFDITNLKNVYNLYESYKPDVIIHAAAKVGGIGANSKFPADYFYDNIMMGINLIHATKTYPIEKLVLIGTICSYPKFTPIPFKESDIWNGYPEETNAPYGIAKKALLTQAQAYKQQYGLNYIYLMPVNLYGIGDNFDDATSHVIPALIKKFALAKKEKMEQVEIWGTGSPTREFLYVDDCADAIVKCTQKCENPEPINLGFGNDISINHLAEMIKSLVGYDGEIFYNSTYPDGQPKRCLDVSKSIKQIGIYAKTDLYHGLKRTIDWYLSKI